MKTTRHVSLLVLLSALALGATTAFAATPVSNLQPVWDAVGGGGVYSAYYGPLNGYVAVSPGSTAPFDGREAGIIKAGFNTAPADDEGLFGFKPAITIDAFATATTTYDVQNQTGVNPVWMTIEVDTGAVDVGDTRVDNTAYQFVPTSNPPSWHTVDAGAGQWEQWTTTTSGIATGTPMTLSDIATANPGRNVVRAYLRLGMGDSYYNVGTGTTAWVDQATLGGVTYDFVIAHATTPSLGVAATYGVLSSTYTNTSASTTINGDVGFTTGPAVAPLGAHTYYGSGVPYSTAGTNAGAALVNLDSQVCTYTFPTGVVVLATDIAHASSTYTPGVYCIDSAVSVGVGGITLSGAGTYIFRSAGALNAEGGSIVTLAGASVDDVFWTPSGATTLNANATFAGTVISTNLPITTLGNVSWTGRALTFGGVVITGDTDTISATAPLSSTKDITSFSFPEGTGVITGTNIAVIVPSGTNLTALTPTIGITGASVSPLGGVVHNFTSPVSYIVTADNASTKTYTVTVGTYYNDIIKAADRLVALQNANGSWDWVVTNQTGPSATTYYSVTGVTAQALLDAYALNNNQTYLDAAKSAGDFIVGTATSTSQRQNAYNVVFLQDLATASASSTYLTKANDILNNIFNEDNYWSHNNGSYCTVTGCTADQLVSAYADYRSGARGLVPWDVAPFVSAEVHAGNTTLAQALVDAIVADTANYDNTAASYDTGLTGKVIAAAAVNDPNLSTYVAELVSRQNIDGSFGLAGDGQAQITSYALRGLVAAGGNASARDSAATYLGLKFGYSGIDGWKDSDNDEYAETDSEVMHALFSVLPASIPYATFTNAVAQTGTSGSVVVTVEIPSGTAVTGDSSWDGVLDSPTPPVAPVTVIIPNFDTVVTSAITVGSSDSDLILDKAVRLVFTGQAGTHAGWYNHAGTFTEITADCAVTGGDVEASQTTNLGAGASCKMDVSGDLVIWTKHFSTFVTYTQTAIPAPAPVANFSGGSVGGFFTLGPDGRLVSLPATPAVPTVSPAIPAQSRGEVLGASAFSFTRGLGLRSRGDDVTELQNRLTAEGVYFGPITGYFGSLTAQGVKNFQKKYGISQVGVVGPQTRARLNLGVAVGTGTGNEIPGCAVGNKFNTTTGLSCPVQTSSGQGCAVGNKFSTTTGLSCPVQ